MDIKNLISSIIKIKLIRNKTSESSGAPAVIKSAGIFGGAFKLRAAVFAIAASVLLSASSLLAAMTACQHCKKQVDEVNTVCPYCLGDLRVPAAEDPAAPDKKKRDNKKGAKIVNFNAAADEIENAMRDGKAAKPLVTEQQVKVYLEGVILKHFHNNFAGQKITLEKIKRDESDPSLFKIVGTAYSSANRPLNTVAKFIETLIDAFPIYRADLNHAAKVDIDNPTLVNYTITLKIDPADKSFSSSPAASQPLDFTFVVPPSKSETVNVKILKINADSNSVLYDMRNKAGDKVTLNLIAEGGMKVVVMIDDKKVYEKNY
jgi:hypothetical protein